MRELITNCCRGFGRLATSAHRLTHRSAAPQEDLDRGLSALGSGDGEHRGLSASRAHPFWVLGRCPDDLNYFELQSGLDVDVVALSSFPGFWVGPALSDCSPSHGDASGAMTYEATTVAEVPETLELFAGRIRRQSCVLFVDRNGVLLERAGRATRYRRVVVRTRRHTGRLRLLADGSSLRLVLAPSARPLAPAAMSQSSGAGEGDQVTNGFVAMRARAIRRSAARSERERLLAALQRYGASVARR